MEKYRGGGMLAERHHALGYEAFEFEFDMTSVDPQVIKQSAFLTKKGLQFSVRGYLDGDNNANHTAYLAMRGEVMENDFGEWEAGKKTTMKVKVALDALKLVMDGDTLFEIDIEHDGLAFAGVDIAATILAAIA